jgi:uncharacterized membrane protein YgcG
MRSGFVFMIALLLLGLTLFSTSSYVFAQSRQPGDVEVQLPGLRRQNVDRIAGAGVVEYINLIVQLMIAFIIALGLIMVVAGGYMYMTAGGNADRVHTGKTMIGGALLGIALAVMAFIILDLIHPQFASQAKNPPSIFQRFTNSLRGSGATGGNTGSDDSSGFQGSGGDF